MIKRRPPKAGKLVPLSFRVTAETRQKLEAAALANGRSLTAEAEARLELTFTQDEFEPFAQERVDAWVKRGEDIFRRLDEWELNLEARERKAVRKK
jgi:hypothetical protein